VIAALLLTLLLGLHGPSAAARGSPDIDPAWSADGKFLAFSRPAPQSDGEIDVSASIWVVGRDGRGARRVTPASDPSDFSRPAWAPDGGWLSVQVSARYSAPSTDVVRSDGRDLTAIGSAPGSSSEALWSAWSPDGRRLALAGVSGIHLVDRDVWRARDLTPGGAYPGWSPDGSRIVFALGGTLAIVVVDSGAVTRLPAPAALAAWAPDGTRIAYSTGCQIGVVSVGATGKSPRALACSNFSSARAPSWSPDGRRFVYSRCIQLACGVYVAPAARPSQAKRIARGENPVWSPDGRRIAYARRVGGTDAGIWLIYPNGAGARPLLR
jgi:Tol biopolymer transport system component